MAEPGDYETFERLAGDAARTRQARDLLTILRSNGRSVSCFPTSAIFRDSGFFSGGRVSYTSYRSFRLFRSSTLSPPGHQSITLRIQDIPLRIILPESLLHTVTANVTQYNKFITTMLKPT